MWMGLKSLEIFEKGSLVRGELKRVKSSIGRSVAIVWKLDDGSLCFAMTLNVSDNRIALAVILMEVD